MTQDLLVTIGEEFFITNNVDGATLRVGLYNDSTDNLSEADNIDAVTSEPTNANYAPVDTSFSASNINGNWGVENDTLLTFDFSDAVEVPDEVDTAYVLAQFDSTEAGANSWHLIANPSLSQTRGIGSIDTLEINAGDLELKLE